MLNLDGYWTLITGASSGFGYEAAKRLAAEGHNLVLVCHNEQRLCQVARELNEKSDIIIMPIDLTKSGSVALLLNECERLRLKINVLINFTLENN